MAKAKPPADAYAEQQVKVAYARALLDRARARHNALLRKLAIGDAIGERPQTALPRDLRRRK